MRRPALIPLAAAALLLSLGAAAATGSVPIPLGEILALVEEALLGLPASGVPPTHAVIFWDIRLPRVALAALIGASLSLAGVAFQGLFRNPLADAYVLGVSSGAAVGAALAFTFGWRFALGGIGAVPLTAFAAALATLALVYRLGRAGGRVAGHRLLLAGVAVGSFLSAVVLILALHQEKEHWAAPVLAWLMGSLSGRGWEYAGAVLPYFVAGAALLAWDARALDAFLFGEEEAHALGVDLERARRRVAAAGGLLTAAAVAAAGVSGFVGLVVPHVARLLAGPGHRRLLPAAALCGGAFLVWADCLARTAFAPAEVPVGIFTSLVGGPFFLHLLRSRRGEVL